MKKLNASAWAVHPLKQGEQHTVINNWTVNCLVSIVVPNI